MIGKIIKEIGVAGAAKLLEPFTGGLTEGQKKTEKASQAQKSVKQSRNRSYGKGSLTGAVLTAAYNALGSNEKKEIEKLYDKRAKGRQEKLKATAKQLENKMKKEDPIAKEILKNTPKPKPRPSNLNKGGMAKKSRTGHMDYRKGGMVYGKK